jgi:undecaprenyl-diphosphatase
MIIAQAMSFVSSADHHLMHRLNQWRPPRWLRWWMIMATRCGDGWLWAVCGLILLWSHDHSGPSALIAAAVAVTVGILLFRWIKRMVRRPRPIDLMPHCWAELLPPDQFSFPSGHSITAFAVAISLGSSYPAFSPLLLFFAINIAVSRVLLGMHYASDVIAGSAIGAILGFASNALVV